MTSSLRDALRQSGVLDQFKPVERKPKPKPKPKSASQGGKPQQRGAGKLPPAQRQRSQEEIDLAKAYALRARAEQREREEKARLEREVAERRRALRAQVQAMLDGNTRNLEEAEIPRHFEYGGKIRRVYVDEVQLQQVNDGRLGVVQMRGRYLLVDRALAERIRGIDSKAIALLVNPDELDDAADELDGDARGAACEA